MKTKKSLVLVVIMFVMSVFMMQSAYAEPGIMPLWSDIATTSHGLNITDGTAKMRVTVRAYGNIDRVEITSKLQQYKNDDWDTIETYNVSNNRLYLLWEEEYSTLDKGYTYRLFTEIRVYELNESGDDYILKEKIEMTKEDTY